MAEPKYRNGIGEFKKGCGGRYIWDDKLMKSVKVDEQASLEYEKEKEPMATPDMLDGKKHKVMTIRSGRNPKGGYDYKNVGEKQLKHGDKVVRIQEFTNNAEGTRRPIEIGGR